MSRRPYFPFYPPDWLSAPEIELMTPAQEGAYIRLLAWCWKDDDCSLPDDYDTLCTLARFKRRLKPSLQKVLDCFQKHPLRTDRLTHPRLWAIFQEYEDYREKASERGRRGAEKRWGTPSASMEKNHAQGMLGDDSSLSSSLSQEEGDARDPSSSTRTHTDDCRDMADKRKQIAANRTPAWNPEGWPMTPPCPKCRKPLRLRKNSKTGTLYYKHHPEVGLGCPFSCDAEELPDVVQAIREGRQRR